MTTHKALHTALVHLDKGEWEAAHKIVQPDESPEESLRNAQRERSAPRPTVAWHQRSLNRYLTERAATAAPKSGPDRKSTRLNSSHMSESRMPSSA